MVKPLTGEALIRKVRQEGSVLYTYGLGDYWGSYKMLYEAFNKKYNVTRLDIDLSSSGTVAKLKEDQEAGTPLIDTGIVGVSNAMGAKKDGLLGCYLSPETPSLYPWAYDQENPKCPSWYAVYYGTMVIMVNTEVIKEIPKSWKDLLNPAYKGKIGYMDPRESATGFVGVVAAAYANGGSLENIDKGIEFFRKLHRAGNVRSVFTAQDFVAFAQGRTPIYINYDYNYLIQKEKTKVSGMLVIPEDGTVRHHYVALIPKKPSHPYAMKLMIDFMLSKEGQTAFMKGYNLPVRRDMQLPTEIREKLPPESAYKHVVDVDWSKGLKAFEKVKTAWESVVSAK